jgi:pentatricopeptide repeat protein
VLQAWKGANASINAYAYNAVIRGFCGKMKVDEAEGVFLDMEKQGVVPDAEAMVH